MQSGNGMSYTVRLVVRRVAARFHRLLPLAIAAFIPVLVTCDNSPTAPEDPTSVEAHARDLFPDASTRTSALAQIADIHQQVNRGDTAQARAKVFALVDFMMTAFREGKLAGGTSATAGNAASSLINDLFKLVGLDPPNLPDGALSDDGAAKVVGPQGGEVVTPSGAAGVEIPAGAFDQSVLVTVTKLPAPAAPGVGPLPTALKQYGPYYDFSTYPNVAQFGSALRVGLCQVTNPSSPFYPPEPHDRLRLAHKVGVGIEILDRVDVNDFLHCLNVSASVAPVHGWRGALASLARGVISRLTPASAYAAHGGLGGKVKSFSPFGAVDPAVNTVAVTLASPSVVAGNTNQANAVLKDADGNVLGDRVIAWTSSNEALATVSSSGLVTGVGEGGPVTITATSEGQSGSAPVTVIPAPVALVRVSPSSPSVNVGETVQLTATTKDSHGNLLTGRAITWTSSNEALATVSSSGLVSGVAAGGPVTITATSEGMNATAGLTVTPAPVVSVTLSPESPTVNVGETVQLSATMKDANGNVLIGRDVVWTSSNEGLATVSSSGLVTGLVEGPVTITGTSEGQSGTVVVTVTPALVASVTVSPESPSVSIGSTVQLSATTKDGNGNALTGRDVSWASSNNGLATVSSSGLVTGIVDGSVTITASSEGKSGVANVTVTLAPVASISVNPASQTINVTGTVQLTATTKDGNGNVLSGRVISWTSSNSALATVSSSGLVTGLGAGGPVTITAASEGQSGTAAVTIIPIPVASVTVSPASVTINGGATVQLTATTRDANANVLSGRVITWTSNNGTLASVNSSGLVTALAAGSVTVTATSEGQTGTASVLIAAASCSAMPAPTGPGASLIIALEDAEQRVLPALFGSGKVALRSDLVDVACQLAANSIATAHAAVLRAYSSLDNGVSGDPVNLMSVRMVLDRAFDFTTP